MFKNDKFIALIGWIICLFVSVICCIEGDAPSWGITFVCIACNILYAIDSLTHNDKEEH